MCATVPADRQNAVQGLFAHSDGIHPIASCIVGDTTTTADPKETPMPTTTTYSNWTRVTGQATLDGGVEEVLLGEATEAEIEAVTKAYRAAINAALPDSVSLCGDEFYGNAYPADCADQADYPHDEDGILDLAAIVEGVDFWEVAQPILGW